MAYTKIIVIRGRLDKCLGYVGSVEKTYLETAVDYTLDRDKTERVCFETALTVGGTRPTRTWPRRPGAGASRIACARGIM